MKRCASCAAQRSGDVIGMADWRRVLGVTAAVLLGLVTGQAQGTGAPAATTPAAGAPATGGAAAQEVTPPKPTPGLKLHTLDADSAPADPFPPADPKNFTATSPTVATVDAFLKALWGYDPKRIWRVEGIQATPAPGISRVTVFVSERGPGAKVQPSAFFITPDGKHAIAGDGVIPFGERPFADIRQVLEARADGPYRGSANKQLMLVEFADMQCPHCKEAQGVMDQLVKDFPGARVVYQSFPLTAIHPFAFKAAANGVCIAKQKNEAFFTYLQAVYDAQDGLTAENGDETLKNAVTKAGLDPGAVGLCAATQATKDAVNASVKLGEDVGVDQTPLLSVNGHVLPVLQIPYETLKTIVSFQAAQDGVARAAAPTGTR